MRAVVLTAYGDTSMLELRDVPEPRPSSHEVKVRMVGAGINPIDWKLRNGSLKTLVPLVFPAVLGRDVSGIVVEVGGDVREFKVGDRVVGLVQEAYADFVVAPADAWAAVPRGMDLVDAAALPLVLLTGAQLIDEAIRPTRGDALLVAGAVGNVGRVAVFIAKARGVRVWAGVRRSQQEAATSLGTDHVTVLEDDGEVESLPRFDAVADTVGGATTSLLLRKVKRGGILGTVVGEMDGAGERGVLVRTILTHTDSARLAALVQAVATGSLRIPIAKRLPLSEVREGQGLAERHHGEGKIILTGAPDAPQRSPGPRREPREAQA